jgi:predicted small lipoprotein YifL
MKENLLQTTMHNNIAAALLSVIMILGLMSACGRRGDPVLIPAGQDMAEKSTAVDESVKQEPDQGNDKDSSGYQKAVSVPDAPDDIRGVYTGGSIVLSWDEVLNQGVRLYRIYRSSGSAFVLAGESVTPAYSDQDVAAGMTYLYRVSAVGGSEGRTSPEIRIVTEADK